MGLWALWGSRDDPTALVDGAGRVLSCNRSLRSLFRLSRSELVDLRLEDLIDPDTMTPVEGWLEKRVTSYWLVAGVKRSGVGPVAVAWHDVQVEGLPRCRVVQFRELLVQDSWVSRILSTYHAMRPVAPVSVVMVPLGRLRYVGEVVASLSGMVGGSVVALTQHTNDLGQILAVLAIGAISDWVLGVLDAARRKDIHARAMAAGLVRKALAYPILVALLHTVGFVLEHYVLSSFVLPTGKISQVLVVSVMTGLFAGDAYSAVLHADSLLDTHLQEKLLGKLLKHVSGTQSDQLGGLESLARAQMECREGEEQRRDTGQAASGRQLSA